MGTEVHEAGRHAACGNGMKLRDGRSVGFTRNQHRTKREGKQVQGAANKGADTQRGRGRGARKRGG